MSENFDRLKTALADRYTIQEELGAGGMATVYLAEDLKHHRKVALKVLRPELAAALGPERFLREIEVAANLTHPHILPLFDSGEADGFLYYAMPYIEGQSLRDKLVHEGELPVQDAVKILREVVDALAHAHERGVVHRDIKPDNVLLSGRHALVVDFGIAKAVTEATGALTATGVALGTPTYMAPEQAAADEHIDHRADIYAVGVLAYEMLAGRPPFTGTTSQMVLAAHLTEAPDPITKYRQAVPPALAHLIMKCLEKKPADRWQSAEELLPQLEALATPSGGITPAETRPVTARKTGIVALGAIAVAVIALGLVFGLRGPAESPTRLDPDAIAVFPFRVSGDPSSVGYLREGIPELLYTKITGEAGPRVVEPGTVFSAWRRAVVDEADDLAMDVSLQLAQQLGAGQLLLGVAVGTPASLTLSGTLHGVPDGEVLAQASAAGSPDSLVVLIDRLVAELLVEQAREGTDRLEALTSMSPVALRAYLAGQRAYRRGLFPEAFGHFGEALDTDSMFALAALGLHRAARGWGTSAPAAGRSRGTQRAWELQDRLNVRDRALLNAYVGANYPGLVGVGGRLAAAEAAVDAAPDHAEVWFFLGSQLKQWGRYLGVHDWLERAAAALDRSLALDSAVYRVIEYRIQLAILQADTALVRRLERLFLRTSPDGLRSDYLRWHVAQALGDTAALSQLRARSMEWGGQSIAWIGHYSILNGLVLDDFKLGASSRRARAVSVGERRRAMNTLRWIATVNGRPSEALAYRDSGLVLRQQQGLIPENVLSELGREPIYLGLLEPGYDSAASAFADQLAARVNGPGAPYQALCFLELWRVHVGDTATTRESIGRLRALATSEGRGRSGYCPLLLEAQIQQMAAPLSAAPLIERLDSLMRSGPLGLAISRLDNFLLAGLWEQSGDRDRALQALRRRPYWANNALITILPAYLREEGRLAALVGDTAGAIRAYDHYLTIRTNPEPSVVPQVDAVKAALARLVGESGRR